MIKNSIKNILITISLILFVLSSGIYAGFGFTMKNVDGKEVSFSDFSDKKAIVLIFVSTQCPVSNAYNERMEELNKEYSKKIPFIGINSNHAEAVSDIKNHSIENNMTFPILKDIDNKFADSLKASFTPEVFVFNPKGDLLYHGRIDNSRRADKVKVNDLKDALNEILAGKKVTVSDTKAFGCTIKRIKK